MRPANDAGTHQVVSAYLQAFRREKRETDFKFAKLVGVSSDRLDSMNSVSRSVRYLFDSDQHHFWLLTAGVPTS